MGKHTPGEWKVWGGGINVRTKKGHIFIAACGSNDSQRSIEEYQANARLISAAPDLLEACKKAYQYIGNIADGKATIIFTKLQQAIAKAEGK